MAFIQILEKYFSNKTAGNCCHCTHVMSPTHLINGPCGCSFNIIPQLNKHQSVLNWTGSFLHLNGNSLDVFTVQQKLILTTLCPCWTSFLQTENRVNTPAASLPCDITRGGR